MVATEVKVPRTEFELGIPPEKLAKQKRIEKLEKTLKEAKERKIELLKERAEIKEAIGKEERTQIKTKEKKKAKLLKKIGELTKIKPKKLDISAEGRAKLLRAIIEKKKRPVSILRRVDDKIPSVFINGKEREQRKQLSFLGRGGLI